MILVFLFILEIAARAERSILDPGLTFNGDLCALKDKSAPDLTAVGDRFLAAFAIGLKIFYAMRHYKQAGTSLESV